MLVPVDTKLLLLAVVLRDFPDRTRTRPRAFATIVRIVRVLIYPTPLLGTKFA